MGEQINVRHARAIRSKPRVIIMLCALVVAGCYQAKTDEKGQTIRLNVFTGEVAAVTGDRLTIVKVRNPNLIASLAVKKEWPVQPLPIEGTTPATVITKYVGDAALFRLRIEKGLEKGKYPLGSFNLILADSDGLEVAKDNVPLVEMTQIVGDKPGEVAGLVYSGRIAMNVDEYQSVSHAQLGWSGFPD